MALVYTSTAQQECARLPLISCESLLELGQRKEQIFSNYFKLKPSFIFITARQKQYNVSEPFPHRARASPHGAALRLRSILLPGSAPLRRQDSDGDMSGPQHGG